MSRVEGYRAPYTVEQTGTDRGVIFAAGDAVQFTDGAFTRYGTVEQVRAYYPQDGMGGTVMRALVRCGHGFELVPLYRLTRIATGEEGQS